METKICRNCENMFLAKNRNRAFCSISCSEEWYSKERENRKTAQYVIFERDCFSCVYCGKSPIEYPGLLLVVDHVIPISKGGNESIYNLVTCCSRCNFNKADLMLEESVYKRIYARNLERTKTVSESMQRFTELVFKELRKNDTDEYNKKQTA